MKRVAQPAGVCLAILGSDGAGKSTLLARLRVLLRPAFLTQHDLHFRPAVFEEKKTGVVTNPHGKMPRNIFLSCLKVVYYFADHWAGWWLIVRPAIRRGELVIFDRSFDDLLVDEKRYRLQGTAWLVKILRRLLPRADRTFVLAAPAQLLHQRKRELSVAELERQQMVLRELANNGGSYVLVAAELPAEEVAEVVWREVQSCIAAREAGSQ